MKKIIPFIGFLFYSLGGHASNDQDSLLSVEIKLLKKYPVKLPKNYFRYPLFREKFGIYTDSVDQRNFDIEITIKNNATKPAFVWLMTCSWYNNFTVNNGYIFFNGWGCDSNYPEIVEFKPGESKVYNATLNRSIKFDYPCAGCVYGKQVPTTKLGLVLLQDPYIRGQYEMFDYNVLMDDKSIQKIVWSNPLYLLDKQSQQKTFEIKSGN